MAIYLQSNISGDQWDFIKNYVVGADNYYTWEDDLDRVLNQYDELDKDDAAFETVKMYYPDFDYEAGLTEIQRLELKSEWFRMQNVLLKMAVDGFNEENK